jgi:hypothetical protein
MAGTKNRNLMSVQEARSRLLEFGRQRDSVASTLGGPILRLSLAALVGAYLGHRMSRQENRTSHSSVVSVIGRAATTVAPLVIAQFVRSVMGPTGSHADKSDCA